MNFLLTLPGNGQLQLGLWGGLELLRAGEGEGGLVWGVMDARQPRGEAVCCGPGWCVLEGNTPVEVSHKNLEEATPSNGKRMLSFPLAETETILRTTNKMNVFKRL